jgi:hypothetical protein
LYPGKTRFADNGKWRNYPKREGSQRVFVNAAPGGGRNSLPADAVRETDRTY